MFDPHPNDIEICEIMEGGTVTEIYAPFTANNPEKSAFNAVATYLNDQPERVAVLSINCQYRVEPHPMFIITLVTGPIIDPTL